MHIVHILPELNQGGVEATILNLNREMVKAGHECTVISNGGQLVKDVEEAGGKHVTMDVCSKNPLTFGLRVHALRARLHALRPTLIHTHSRVPAWMVRFANKPLRLPWITTVHGFNSISKYSEIMTRGDRVICVSQPVKDYIQQHYQVPEDKIDVIHPGINPTEFDPETVDMQWVNEFKTQHDLGGKFIATTVGRITELKDYDTFIRAIAICAENDPDIRGLIVGGVRPDKQAYYERLQNLIHELGVASHVQCVGSQTQIAEIYSLSDVLVSCSKKPESFGLTLTEALAMNTPVIATRHGGPLDIIREGENGFLFEPQHPEELARKISDKARLQCVDLRTDTLERFGLTHMMDATLKTYQYVICCG